MIGKVLKYDLKSIGKSLFPIYLVTFCLCLFTRLVYALGESVKVFEILSFITNIFALVSVVALIAMSFIACITRFYTNLFKEQGYLTNVLPAKIDTHVLSKFLSAFIYCAISVVLAAASLVIMYFSIEMSEGISGFIDTVKPVLAPFLIMLILSLSLYQSLSFAAYSIGQRSKNKMASSVITGIVLYFAAQLISLAVLGVGLLIKPEYLSLLDEGALEVLRPLLYIVSVLMAAYNVGCYFIAVSALKKKMDLE